jgi:hypothetical protein
LDIEYCKLVEGDFMKKTVCVMVLASVVLCGCDAVRFAPGDAQRENAYLHWRATELAAGLAGQEPVSAELRGLTGLAAQQSRAFVADYGLPKALPAADSAEAILNGSGAAAAATAYQQSLERPDVWQVADGAMEFGLALAGLIGGVYGARAAKFLRQARENAKILREKTEEKQL